MNDVIERDGDKTTIIMFWLCLIYSVSDPSMGEYGCISPDNRDRVRKGF